MDNHHEELEEDQDSLFGSPPPSPQIRGRISSPLLALPTGNVISSGMSTTTAIQNVGTIALPGSQPVSELPINPLALSLNHGVVSRPPAPQVADQAVSRQPSTASDSAGPSTSNARASSSSTSKSRKRPRQQSQSQQADPPGARGPEFSLPDPSAPPPAHFLRNQENLLGQAGVVAGVRPATITHARGATPSNPIIIEDEDAPTIGRSTQFRDPNKRYIDPSLLTAPSNQDIVQVLIGQKDIFPVLESILKLLAGSQSQTPAPPTGFERRGSTRSNASRTSASSHPSTGQPAKKRKLNRVPAGATDWDVPYPFAQGEGPEAYHSNWQHDRGKQLISQLVKLIKGAARKAATKNYLQKEKAKQDAIEPHDRAAQVKSSQLDEEGRARVNNYYRPETATYGMEEQAVNRQIHQVLKDASNGPHLHNSMSSFGPHTATFAPHVPPSSNSQNQPGSLSAQNKSNTFELITTLVAASPNQSREPNSQAIPFNTDCTPLVPSTMAGFEDLAPGSGDSTGVDDQTLFNTWMSLLQTIPVSFDGLSDASGFPTPVPSKSSTPGLDDFSFTTPPTTDFNYGPTAAGCENMDDLDSLFSSMFNQANASQGMDVSAMMTVDQAFSEFSSVIDPELLAISNTSDPGSACSASSVVPQVASPIPSVTSYADTGPATPSSANWETSFPDVFANTEMEHEGSGQDGGDAIVGSLVDFGVLPEGGDIQSTITRADKGKAKATDYSSTTMVVPPLVSRPPSELPATESARPSLCAVDSRDLFTPQPPRPTIIAQRSVVAAARKARREDILRRVEEKKRRLQEELDQTKVKLWETTIEQAALMHIVNQRR